MSPIFSAGDFIFAESGVMTMDANIYQKLVKQEETKIVLLVMDGLGGLPKSPDGMTELENARTPNLDTLAKHGICGLHQAVRPGITPGSGPAHLALFGYDPVEHQVGRGVLAALGIGFDLKGSDVAARGNFCTIDDKGRVSDRRAGRIATEKNKELCKLLREIEIPGIEIFIETVKDYRFLLVLRGKGLNASIADTDPQETGREPIEVTATTSQAKKTAGLLEKFVSEAKKKLAGQHPANMVLLRGFSELPAIPSLKELYQIRSAAIAGYPMYRGVSKLIGMDVLETSGELDDEVDVLEKQWKNYDFFFMHVKPTDSSGEDGDFDKKVSIIEEVDHIIPRIMELKPDVVAVTGDHSTPSVLKYHSWHPVPVLIWSDYCRPDEVKRFGERECMQGGLGPRIPAVDLIKICLANALRLEKFGA